MNKKTCSITGSCEPFPPPNRSEARLRAALDDVLTALTEREAVTHFLTGLFPGGDLIAAEQTLALAGRRPGLTLECVLPFEAQAAHWPEPLRDRYFAAAARCARETLLQRHETPDSRARHSRCLAGRADVLLAVWDGASGPVGYTVGCARARGVPVWLLHPDTLTVRRLP